MRADGSEAHRVTDRSRAEFSPAFSPGGGMLAFVSHRGEDAEIFTVGTDGSRLRQVTDNHADDHAPVFSRSGQIAFVKRAPPEDLDEVYTIHPDGSGLRQLTDSRGPVANTFPDFSPGGGRLVFDRR